MDEITIAGQWDSVTGEGPTRSGGVCSLGRGGYPPCIRTASRVVARPDKRHEAYWHPILERLRGLPPSGRVCNWQLDDVMLLQLRAVKRACAPRCALTPH